MHEGNKKTTNSVQQELLQTGKSNLVKEFFLFFKEHKSYWIVPVVIFAVLLAGLAVLTVMTGGAAAPFIYTLF